MNFLLGMSYLFFLFFLLKGADLVALGFGICEWEVLIMCTVQYE
jgi:hypothetical protein